MAVFEEQLQGISFEFFVPGVKVFAFGEVDLEVGNLECDGLVRLGREKQVLPFCISLLNLLLKRRH